MRIIRRTARPSLFVVFAFFACPSFAQASVCDWATDIISVRNMPESEQTLYRAFTTLLEDKISNDLREILDQSAIDSEPKVELTHIPKLGSSDESENGLIAVFSENNNYAEQYLNSTGFLQLYVFERIAQENLSQVTKTNNVGVQTKVYLGEHRGGSASDEYLVLAGAEDANDIADKTVQFSALLAVSLVNRDGAGNTCSIDRARASEKISEWLADANVLGPILRKIEESLEPARE